MLPTGSACTAASTCEGFCLAESQFGQSTGYLGGYCTANCGNGVSCTSGVCITETLLGQTSSNCRSTCTGAGQGTCRTGYVCTPTGFCRPNCNNGGLLSACGSGQVCQSNGLCL